MSDSLRYAALVLPQFRLQAVLCQSAGGAGGPADTASPKKTHSPAGGPARARGKSTPGSPGAVALVDPRSPKSLLLEVNTAARHRGITPGMSGSQAVAREPTLRLLHACAAAEIRLEGRLREFCETLCPRVEKRASAVWVLDLRGVRIAGWEVWARGALENLRLREGAHARMGIAPRAALALCAAHRADPVRVVEHPESFLEELHFEELGVSDALRQKLHDWGVHVLGDLLRLPRQAALERLGPEAAPLWEIARDTRESVLRLESFEEALEQTLDLEHPLETVAPLLFSLNRLVEHLCARLRLLQRVAAGMRLSLRLENGHVHGHAFIIPAPSREEAVLLRILQTHLETLQFDAAVVGVQLQFEASLPDSRQLALFESPLRDPNRFGETLARLRALAGQDAVGVPLLQDSHREDVVRLGDPLVLFGGPAAPAPALPPGASLLHGTPVGLPLRRFRPPLPARVCLRAHQPAHVAAAGLEATVLESRGPYRLSGDWWEEAAWKHEQWDVWLGGRGGGLYRLSRHTTARAAAPDWWVEGCYDGDWWPPCPAAS